MFIDATVFEQPLEIPYERPFPCDYLKIGCKANIIYPINTFLYCNDSASSCSYDR